MNSPLRQVWKDYNLNIMLFILFAVSWIAQFFVEVEKVHQEALSRGETFQ